MRILWVKAGRLLPLDSGGKLRSYHLARQLDARHDVTLLSYFDGEHDDEYFSALTREFPGALAMTSGLHLDGTLQRGLRYLRCLLSDAPYAVTKFSTPRVATRVANLLHRQAYDVAVCDFLSASLNFTTPSTTPLVLFQHNVEASLWERQAALERNPLRRAVFTIEAAKMRRYEPLALRRFGHVVAVSEHDRAHFAAMAPRATITVVPTGVDVDAFRPPPDGPPQDRSVLFLGSMDWLQNVDAVEWFCGEIWPGIRARVPDAVFRVVGRNPSARVTRLAGESIQVTGTVPSVREYLHRAAVVVVPLRIGGGTRLKIFEAMASARAVVSTRIGAEGLDVENGVNVLIQDDTAGFADAVVRLLTFTDQRRRLERAAFAAAERYDWKHVASRLEDALVRAIREHDPSPPRATGVS